ncbi:hypothetical protein MW887_007232 [Aspergillus wentii]|nr:hypothetical protein MW887_007232 [Aspergillus wentii]
MEVLGLVANIIAVIQLAAQVTQLSYSYVREVKNASRIQKQYLQEVSGLMDILFRVEQVIVETESTGLMPPRPATLDDDALMDCYKELSRLQLELQKRKSRLLRPFQDRELRPTGLKDRRSYCGATAHAGSVRSMYMVLDGVDEMKSPNELLACCLDLARSGIQVLVSSRSLPFIQKKMTTASQLEVTGSTNDLKVYIERRLQDSDFQDELAGDHTMIDNIVSKSGNLQSEARSSLARRLISWILYAKRRLKMEEIRAAFALDEEGLDHENTPAPDVLLRICFGMVVVNQADSTLGLVHTSAYEYLYTVLPPEMPHFDIAQTCLRYLGLKGLMQEPCNSSTELMVRFDELKFLRYSAKHWGDHICNRVSEERLQPLIMELVGDKQLLANAFQALQFRREFEGSLADEIFDSLPKEQHALHIAAYWNLVGTAEAILDAGADVCATDTHNWTPLHWACSRNHLLVADLLVQKGANVNLPDIQGWTPLFWAAFIGNVDLVRLLLSNGADHQFRSTLEWTALHWAISGGHFSVARELLDQHSRSMKTVPRLYTMTMAEIKAYSQETVSPIEPAADSEETDVFSRVVQDFETRKGKLDDAKFNPIWENPGFDALVSKSPWRTLTKGEEINGIKSTIPNLNIPRSNDQERSLRSTPSHWKSGLLVSAIRDQQLASAQMLAKTGAGFNKFCALHIAAHRFDPRYMECLLESGADGTFNDYRGRTALQMAILNGFVETMTALVHDGADVNQPMSAQTKLAQKFASESDLMQVLPAIIIAFCALEDIIGPNDLGAPFPADLDLTPIIHKATEALEVDMIDFLLCRGGRPSANSVLLLVKSFICKRKDSNIETTILYDKFKRGLGLLCFSGADINFFGSVEGFSFGPEVKTTPLTLAATLHGSRDILQDLLNLGADVYHESEETFEPILTAALFGDLEDLSFLLVHSTTCPSPSHWTSFVQEAPEERCLFNRVCFCLRKAGLLDRTNIKGETLLHLATQKGNDMLLTALIAEGARRDVTKEKWNSTVQSAPTEPVLGSGPSGAALQDANALAIAVKNNDISMVSNLLQGGCDPNQTIDEWRNNIPALYHAANQGQREIVSLLLSHGAKTEVTDSHGWRPLHLACFRGHTDIARALIAKGADGHASTVTWNNSVEKPSGLYKDDAWTGTPLHTATIGGHSDIVNILLEHNVDVKASTGVTADHLAYPASGPTALHIALSLNQFPLRKDNMLVAPKLPSPGRLQIAHWLVDAGAMVHGVIQRFSLEDILCLEQFPELWDALVAGDTSSSS